MNANNTTTNNNSNNTNTTTNNRTNYSTNNTAGRQCPNCLALAEKEDSGDHTFCYNPAKPSGRGGGPPPAGRVTYWFCKAKTKNQ